MFKKSKKGYYFWEEFSNIDGLVHGISTRYFGSIKNNGKINEENLKRFLDVLEIDRKNVLFPRQVHGSKVLVLDGQTSTKLAIDSHFRGNDERRFETTDLDVDGLITQRKNVFLGIVTADCLPVIFYEGKMGIVGISHAGYKGILKGILEEMIKGFKKLGGNAKDILIAIGPSIGACCYDVSYERIKMFDKLLNFDGDSGQARMTNVYQVRKGKYFLDLKNIAKLSLISKGVPENNIEVSDICTKDNIKDFFSLRREGKEKFGEFATILGFRSTTSEESIRPPQR